MDDIIKNAFIQLANLNQIYTIDLEKTSLDESTKNVEYKVELECEEDSKGFYVHIRDISDRKIIETIKVVDFEDYTGHIDFRFIGDSYIQINHHILYICETPVQSPDS